MIYVKQGSLPGLVHPAVEIRPKSILSGFSYPPEKIRQQTAIARYPLHAPLGTPGEAGTPGRSFAGWLLLGRICLRSAAVGLRLISFVLFVFLVGDKRHGMEDKWFW